MCKAVFSGVSEYENERNPGYQSEQRLAYVKLHPPPYPPPLPQVKINKKTVCSAGKRGRLSRDCLWFCI